MPSRLIEQVRRRYGSDGILALLPGVTAATELFVEGILGRWEETACWLEERKPVGMDTALERRPSPSPPARRSGSRRQGGARGAVRPTADPQLLPDRISRRQGGAQGAVSSGTTQGEGPAGQLLPPRRGGAPSAAGSEREGQAAIASASGRGGTPYRRLRAPARCGEKPWEPSRAGRQERRAPASGGGPTRSDPWDPLRKAFEEGAAVEATGPPAAGAGLAGWTGPRRRSRLPLRVEEDVEMLRDEERREAMRRDASLREWREKGF
jgi:hypothetical protein